MPIFLSRRDALHAAAGCRQLAATLRSDAVTQSNSRIQEQTLTSAARLEKLAKVFDGHAAAAELKRKSASD